MNLSKQSGDKELFSGERSSKENIRYNYNMTELFLGYYNEFIETK